MVALKYIPERGDIVWLSFDPQAGCEQSGHRPALVLSPLKYNANSNKLAIFCPITNKIKGYSFEVLIPSECKTDGCILADHVKSLDWLIRKVKFIEKTPTHVLNEVLGKLNTLLQNHILLFCIPFPLFC